MDNTKLEQLNQLERLKAENTLKIVDFLKLAVEDNKTYLALTSPTTAQNTAQINKLTRQNIKMIRLLTNLLEETE